MSFLFHILHLTVIAANLTGWMFPRTRRAHLLLVTMTLFSWVVPGFRYGLGYCFVTDWHWQVLEAEGVTDLPASYISYILGLAGFSPRPLYVDAATAIAFTAAIAASLYVNRDLLKKIL